MSEERIPATILAINGISVRYNSVEVVHGVTIDVKERRIVALIGPNGAGKSSVLRAISGLVRPSRGKILFCGTDLIGLPPHEIAAAGIGHVMEDRHLFGSLTVEDNLMLAVQGKGAASGNSMEAVFQRWPILARRRRWVAGSLSGGEQQILAIARALMLRPRLLLLDEPSWGLAPRLVRDLMQTIGQLCAEGMTILLVEQMAKIALNVCHYGYLMANGKIVTEGDARDLLANPDLQASYLGGKASPEKSSVMEALNVRKTRIEAPLPVREGGRSKEREHSTGKKEVHDLEPIRSPRSLSSDSDFGQTGLGTVKENERLRVTRQHLFDSSRIKADAIERMKDIEKEISGSRVHQTIPAGGSFDEPSSKTRDWHAFEEKRREKEGIWVREHSDSSVSASQRNEVLGRRKDREPTRTSETPWKHVSEMSAHIDRLKSETIQKALQADSKEFAMKRRDRAKAWVSSKQTAAAQQPTNKDQDLRKEFEMRRRQRQGAWGRKSGGVGIKSPT
jgi:branched-chain amino acid transport system ATP-binding protein